MSTSQEKPIHWHLFTAEYPPQKSGVGLYTKGLANALYTAGYKITVHTSKEKNKTIESEINKYTSEFQLLRYIDNWDKNKLDTYIHKSNFSNETNRLFFHISKGMTSKSDLKGIEIWLKEKRTQGFEIWTMIHDLSPKLKCNNILFWIKHRKFLKVFIKNSDQILVASDLWSQSVEKMITRKNKKVSYLPVSSAVPMNTNKQNVANIRNAFTSDNSIIIGSFGSFSESAILSEYVSNIPNLLHKHPEAIWLCLGRESEDFCKHLKREFPEVANRISYTGELNPEALSIHIQACDILFQPYPEGVTTKRSSLMVGLAHGKPIVTSYGKKTEDIWKKSEILLLGQWNSPGSMYQLLDRLLNDKDLKIRLSENARKFYRENFSLEQTVKVITNLT